jgi:hypothetical protein
LINARVKNSAGERIGHIDDFVVDPNSGRIQFAVLKLTGDLAKGGAYTPVPWPMLSQAQTETSRSGEPKTIILNIDRSKLESAQSFSVNKWPERSRPAWGQDVYSYYGVPWDSNGAVGATGSGSVTTSTDTGVSTQQYNYNDKYSRHHYRDRDRDELRSTSDKPIDNGTAPDGKDVFKCNPRPFPNSEYSTE